MRIEQFAQNKRISKRNISIINNFPTKIKDFISELAFLFYLSFLETLMKLRMNIYLKSTSNGQRTLK